VFVEGDKAMSLPISIWAIMVAVLGLIAISTGIWLFLRARDVARAARGIADAVEPGPRRRPSESLLLVRVILVVHGASTIAALGLFALIATRTIGSSETTADPYAQRP
jgi:hypothetical protein